MLVSPLPYGNHIPGARHLAPCMYNLDEKTLLSFYSENKNLFYSIVLKYLADKNAVEDIIQDVLLNILKRIPIEFANTSQGKAYIVRALINASINHNKRKDNSAVSVSTEIVGSAAARTQDETTKDLTDEIFSKLSRYEREIQDIYLLYYIEGESLKQIAEAFGSSISTVHRTITKVNKEIRASFAGSMGGYSA